MAVGKKKRSLRYFLRTLALAEVLDAVNITSERLHIRAGGDVRKYFYGVCHRTIRERESGSAS